MTEPWVKWRCTGCRRFGEFRVPQSKAEPTAELLSIRQHDELSPRCKAYLHLERFYKEIKQ